MFNKRSFILFLIICLGLSSCKIAKLPTKKPSIPKSISQGENKEPLLKVYDKADNTVKEMKFEDYIASVVAGEMENTWPLEALAAQAIIARSFVLNFIAEKGGSKYGNAHISTDIEEAQAWNPAAVNDRVKEAVNKTRGQVIVYKNQFVNTWFHSHAGGITATAKEGLNYKGDDPPYIRVVKSPDSEKAPPEDKEWSTVFSKTEVLKALSSMGVPLTDFTTVKIGSRGPSGRTTVIKFDNIDVSAPELRLALGNMKMRSTLLTSLVYQDGQLIMKGKGYGHGVGMSQWGAFNMAEQGKTAMDIIKYYYKGVNIVKMWD